MGRGRVGGAADGDGEPVKETATRAPAARAERADMGWPFIQWVPGPSLGPGWTALTLR